MTAPAPRPLRKAALAAVVVALVAAAACRKPAPAPAQQAQPEAVETSRPAVERTLLYPGAEDTLLTAFRVSLPQADGAQQDMAALVRRYLAGPVGPGQVQPFPDHSTLRALFLTEGGAVVLDLGGAVREGGGSDTEVARVYGLVDTLCWNFPQVKAVRILVGGQEVDSLLGHLDLSRPLPPEPGLLEASLRTKSEGAGAQ